MVRQYRSRLSVQHDLARETSRHLRAGQRRLRESAKIESMERRTLLTAVTTVVTITADAPIATYNGTSAHPGQFEVRRKDGPTDTELSVFYQVLPATTAAHSRYAALVGHVNIAAGATSAVFDIHPTETSHVYPNDTVVIGLVAKHYHVSPSLGQATVTIQFVTPAPSSDFFESDEQYESSFTFNSGSYARTNYPFTDNINFTSILSGLGASGTLIPASIRVIEVSSNGGTEIDSDTPFQFDQASNFDATNNAAGTLTVMATGTTAADTTRYYEVYFSTTGSFTAPSVPTEVTTTSGVMNQGESSFEIQTATATYYLQAAGGGFSEIDDDTDANWLGYNTNSNNGDGFAGAYRGLPNTQSVFHAGLTDCTTTMTAEGPLHTQFSITGNNGGGDWAMTWDIYPSFAVATYTEMPNGDTLLLNYEGTPAGESGNNFGTDLFNTRSDGDSSDLTQTWNYHDGIGTDTNTGEWVYFGSTTENHYLFLAQNTDIGTTDSYAPGNGTNGNNEMTIFGFGRGQGDSNPNFDTTLPESYTIGLVDDSNLGSNNTDFSNASATIYGSYEPVTVTNGSTATNPSPSAIRAAVEAATASAAKTGIPVLPTTAQAITIPNYTPISTLFSKEAISELLQ